MVVLHVKRGDESLFLFETTTAAGVGEVVPELARLHNGVLRVGRLCTALEQLAAHGIMKPPNMQGLTDEQVAELKLTDEWSERCYPSGGSRQQPDGIGLRTGNAPTEKLAEVISKTIAEARALVSKDQVKARVNLSMAMVEEAVEKLRGATMIVYPMGLPPYDDVQLALEDKEDLSGKQDSKFVIPEDAAQLWWAGKELQRSKKLHEYVGKNEKTKIIAKLQKYSPSTQKGSGAPVREPAVDAETQKQMMAYAYRKQEEWKKLEEADENAYLNAEWADTSSLKSKLQGTDRIRMP